MKHVNLRPYAALMVLVALFSSCSGSTENSGATNTSAPQANSNSDPHPPIAQGSALAAAPSPAPPIVETILPPPAPAAKSAATSDANAATAPTAGDARAPKLVVSEKKIDYGKQPQDRTLVRAIVIKNGGLANLNIELVVPS